MVSAFLFACRVCRVFLWINAIVRFIYVSRSTATQCTYHYSDINTLQLNNRMSVVVIVLVKLECMMVSLSCGAQTTDLSSDPLLSTCAMYVCIPCNCMHSIESHV